jgi:triacylglycerol lipase
MVGPPAVPDHVPKLSAPVVLAHGLCGFDRICVARRPVKEYFPGIRQKLEAAGNRVLATRVSPTAGIAARAAQLRAFIRREVGDAPVHLIGHSMGGLDARFMISRLGMDRQVLSLTTVGTPHRGTAFADWGVRRLARLLCPLLRAAGVPDDAFFDLTTAACRRFNEDVPDAPGVRYFSVAGVCEQPWLGPEYRLPARIVREAEGPNDGLVSVASAAWGERTDVWDGDHLNIVNWPNRRMRRAGAWRDRAADYGRLLERLADL